MPNIFNQHPKEVGETYLQHLWAAWKYSFTFLLLFVAAFIHSIFPFLFKGTSSAKVIAMAEHMKARKEKWKTK